MKKLIIFEGIDGSGKTTSIEKKRYLNFGISEDSNIKFTKLPANYSIYDEGLKALREGKLSENEAVNVLYGEHITYLTDLILYMENKFYDNIVADRSFLSFLAYQKNNITNISKINGIKYKSNLWGLFNYLMQIAKKYDWEVIIFFHDIKFINKAEDKLEKQNKQEIEEAYESIMAMIEKIYGRKYENLKIIRSSTYDNN